MQMNYMGRALMNETVTCLSPDPVVMTYYLIVGNYKEV